MYSITRVRNTRFGLVFCGMTDKDMYYLCHISTWIMPSDDDYPPIVVKRGDKEYSIVVKRAYGLQPLIDYAYEEIDVTPFSEEDLDMNSFPYEDLNIPHFVWACASGIILTNPV